MFLLILFLFGVSQKTKRKELCWKTARSFLSSNVYTTCKINFNSIDMLSFFIYNLAFQGTVLKMLIYPL